MDKNWTKSLTLGKAEQDNGMGRSFQLINPPQRILKRTRNTQNLAQNLTKP